MRAGVRFAEVAERAASFVVYKTSEVRCHVCIHVPCDFSLSCVPKGRLTYWRARPMSCFRPRAAARGAAPSFAQIGLDADDTGAAPASSGAVRSSTDIPEPPGRAPLRGVSRDARKSVHLIRYTEVKTPPTYLDQPHAHGPAREIRGTPEESSSSQRHNRHPPAREVPARVLLASPRPVGCRPG